MKMKVEYIPDKININIFFILMPVNNYYKTIYIIHYKDNVVARRGNKLLCICIFGVLG